MAKFFYKAKKGPGEETEGLIEANDLDQAVEKITALGYVPVDVDIFIPQRKKNLFQKKERNSFFSRKVSPSALVTLTRQLYDLVDSGVPFLRALSIVKRQSFNPYLKKALGEMHAFIQDGGLFSDALSQHKDIFPDLYIHMVKAGEMSGNLDVILDRLAMFLEKDDEIRAKVKNSLIYPGLILGVGGITIFVLLTFVIPRLTEMFDEVGSSLPLPTVVLMSMSGFLARFWWLFLLGIIFIVFSLRRFGSTPSGKLWLDQKRLQAPVLGALVQQAEVGRFARTLSMLLESGVTIVPALESVSEVLTNEVLRNDARDMAKRVDGGSSLNEALKESSGFPEIAKNMIIIGEEAGRLDQALLKLAISYEKKVDLQTKTVTSLLEPILIVGIGLVVGFVVISMLLPIFQMNFIIQ